MFGEISLRSSTGVESGSDEALPGFFLGSFIGMTYGAGRGGGGGGGGGGAYQNAVLAEMWPLSRIEFMLHNLLGLIPQ